MGAAERPAQDTSVNLKRDELLIKLGHAEAKWSTGWRLVDVEVDSHCAAFRYTLDAKKLRQARRREGRYRLRSNLTEGDPATLWNYYLQLGQVEEAFRNLKGDLAIRPIHHQEPARIEAHIFIAFLAYCLHVTIGHYLKGLAPGLTPRSLFEKFAAVQMIDVHIPTTDCRELLLTRYTQPEPELTLLLDRLKLDLPDQPPPKITAAKAVAANPVWRRPTGYGDSVLNALTTPNPPNRLSSVRSIVPPYVYYNNAVIIYIDKKTK